MARTRSRTSVLVLEKTSTSVNPARAVERRHQDLQAEGSLTLLAIPGGLKGDLDGRLRQRKEKGSEKIRRGARIQYEEGRPCSEDLYLYEESSKGKKAEECKEKKTKCKVVWADHTGATLETSCHPCDRYHTRHSSGSGSSSLVDKRKCHVNTQERKEGSVKEKEKIQSIIQVDKEKRQGQKEKIQSIIQVDKEKR